MRIYTLARVPNIRFATAGRICRWVLKNCVYPLDDTGGFIYNVLLANMYRCTKYTNVFEGTQLHTYTQGKYTNIKV